MNHSFKVEIAEKYGIEKAVLLENFYFWIKKNEANGKNMHEGKAYTYNTTEAFAILFPYIKERKIAQILREMENIDGLLISGQFHSYDRTKSYTLTDKALELYGENVNKENPQHAENEESIIQNPDVPLSEKCRLEDTKNVGCLNTDINTDKKQDINIKAQKPKGQHKEVYDKYLENHTKLYEQGKLRTDKATINYTVTGTLIKNLLKTYTLEEILFVIDRAVSDKWVVEHGYSLSLILSAGQINKLLNAKPMQKEAPKKKYKYGQFPTVTDAREYIERTKAKEPNWDAQFFHDFFCEWVGAGCPVDSEFDDFYMANKK